MSIENPFGMYNSEKNKTEKMRAGENAITKVLSPEEVERRLAGVDRNV